nr:MAG TPA: hypothetical protein [Bacteriophage sp.]
MYTNSCIYNKAYLLRMFLQFALVTPSKIQLTEGLNFFLLCNFQCTRYNFCCIIRI